MGGGGGGYSFTSNELSKLHDQARSEIRQATESQRNIFISFDSADLAEVNLLRGQKENDATDLSFKDYSVKEPYNSENAEYIKRNIREQIKQSSVTLVYVSDATASSDWVNWEIRESIKLGKGVVAVHKGETPPSHLPAAIREHGCDVISWQHDKIVAAIEKANRER